MMTNDIRVRTKATHKGIYNDLKQVGMAEMHEIFFLCACLGFQARERTPLRGAGEDRFWSATFSADEWACMYAMQLKANGYDLSVLTRDSDVLGAMEEYAAGGMDVLVRECLDHFLVPGGAEPRLDVARAADAPRAILHFIYERAPAIAVSHLDSTQVSHTESGEQ